MMKILHTSDWHLGKTLYSKKDRQNEHIAFLKWLIDTIISQKIESIIIAGDIFDTSNPNIGSQKIYYDFLIQARNTCVQNIIIVGGNHDSPSFLNAPKEILAALNVIVIGNATADLADEIILLKNKQNKPQAIICGVPFLRERDLLKFNTGESFNDRSQRLNESIKKHYEEIATLAAQMRDENGGNLPIIATGHLSVAGGIRNDDDGVRDTYIGNIQEISCDIFPTTFDYVALGHYHVPSAIKPHIRYSGSPIPMGFGEAKQTKCVYVLDFESALKIETISIPSFQNLETIKGNKEQLENRLNELLDTNESYWLEVIYTGEDIFSDLTQWANQKIENSKLEILKIQNQKLFSSALNHTDTIEDLEDLDAFDVFDIILNKNNISDTDKEILKLHYKEIVDGLDIEQ